MLLSTRFLTFIPLFSFLPSNTMAATICTYAGRDCSGLYGCCTSVVEGKCCQWFTGSALGWSVLVSEATVPSWVATTSFDRNCEAVSARGRPEEDGTVCLSVSDTPDAVNFASGKWTATSLEARDVMDHSSHQACATPDVVGFKTLDGKEHLVKVPAGEGQAEYLSQLLETQDFEALLTYEHV